MTYRTRYKTHRTLTDDRPLFTGLKKRNGIMDFFKGTSAEAKIQFCNIKKPLHHDCEITYEIFDILIKIAAYLISRFVKNYIFHRNLISRIERENCETAKISSFKVIVLCNLS